MNLVEVTMGTGEAELLAEQLRFTRGEQAMELRKELLKLMGVHVVTLSYRGSGEIFCQRGFANSSDAVEWAVDNSVGLGVDFNVSFHKAPDEC